MNVALMVDPQNNDGELSASPDGIGFAKGTGNDIALATGTLAAQLTSGIEFAGNVGHPSFFQDIALTDAGDKVFLSDLNPGAILHEFLTTPGGPNNVFGPNGKLVAQWVDGTGAAGQPATGVVTLDPKTPLSVRPALLDHDPHGLDGLACATRS